MQGSARVSGELADAVEPRREPIAERFGAALQPLPNVTSVLAPPVSQVRRAADGIGVKAMSGEELVEDVKGGASRRHVGHSSMSQVVRVRSLKP